MAVDLPPALPPLAQSPDLLTRSAVAVTVPHRGDSLQIMSELPLSGAEVRAAIAPAASLEEALALLTRAYRANGYPGAQLLYARQGSEVWVQVVPGRLRETQVDRPLTPYFADLPGESALRDRELEPRRILASLHADRAGLQAVARLHPDDAGNLRLIVDTERGAAPTRLAWTIDNTGQRYSTSELMTAVDFATGTGRGDEFGIGAHIGLDHPGDDEYAAHRLTWNRVTPWGLFGVGARHTRYVQTDRAQIDEGRFWTGELNWLMPLYADFQSRWGVKLQVDRSQFTHRISSLDQPEQLYTSGEIATQYHRRFSLLDLQWRFDGSLALRQGLNDERLPAATLDYQLLRPSARLVLDLGDGRAFTVEARAQLSNDRLPAQEQWVLGGRENLQTQRHGVVVGDEGSLMRVSGDLGRYQWREFAVQPHVFAERGRAQPDGAPERPQLSSAGAGLRVAAWGWLSADLVYAERLDERGIPQRVLDETETPWWFSLRAAF